MQKEIHYSGNVESGFNVCWGSLSFPLAAEQIEDILTEFGGQKGVPLGANRDGSSADSFGTWLCDNGGHLLSMLLLLLQFFIMKE